ncbi:hypothetical protein TI04_02670 [Achromatium sp. WMS2]|nr:hypothetical protein TI04_02670 [Achromatium sp. WMS2]
MVNLSYAILLVPLLISSISDVVAEEFLLPPNDVSLVGELKIIKAKHEDTLIDIARANGLGRDEIVNANPKVDPWLPGAGTEILLPNRYILPSAPRTGIVVNTPEMRLYYYPPGNPRRVITHPVSVGRVDWNTPLGITKVATKLTDPVWRPPASIRREALEKGTPLPEVVPAGPDNPLGRFAMRLAFSGSYLIHGTDKPFGIGMQVTHGCMRLYPEDIESLFKQVPVGTQVNLVNEPIKIGWLADTLFIEVTPALEQDVDKEAEFTRKALDRVYAEQDHRAFVLDGAALNLAIREKRGIPVAISKFE